jgi:hypothetical protein
VLEEAAVSASELPQRLDRDADSMGTELPPGEWRSLSAELLRALQEALRPPR